MRINTRFSVAIHILALHALFKDSTGTSDMIAKSVNTNPVVIRRINAMLKKAGLISVKAGVGGASLNRPPEKITLLDVYNAVKTSSDASVFDMHGHPNAQCPVGSNIHAALAGPVAAAQNALEESLRRYTLADVAGSIAHNAEIKNG